MKLCVVQYFERCKMRKIEESPIWFNKVAHGLCWAMTGFAGGVFISSIIGAPIDGLGDFALNLVFGLGLFYYVCNLIVAVKGKSIHS